jgi:hypothetical protein
MPSMFLIDVLHQILDLQHTSDRHLQAPSRHIVEGADDEHRFLFAVLAAGIELYPEPVQNFRLFFKLHR